ncbi:MAG: hypothetical protein ACP5SJ_01925 [Candidatus Micrarchaeia archaeon]
MMKVRPKQDDIGKEIVKDLEETSLGRNRHYPRYTEKEIEEMREDAEKERERIMKLVEKYKRDEKDNSAPFTVEDA